MLTSFRLVRNKFRIKLPRKKQYAFFKKIDKDSIMHLQKFFFFLLLGFKIKLIALVKIGKI